MSDCAIKTDEANPVLVPFIECSLQFLCVYFVYAFPQWNARGLTWYQSCKHDFWKSLRRTGLNVPSKCLWRKLCTDFVLLFLSCPESTKISTKLPNFSSKHAYLWKFLYSSETRRVLKTTLINSSRNHIIKCIYKLKSLSHEVQQDRKRWSCGVYFWFCHWLTFIVVKSQLTSPTFPICKWNKKSLGNWRK